METHLRNVSYSLRRVEECPYMVEDQRELVENIAKIEYELAMDTTEV